MRLTLIMEGWGDGGGGRKGPQLISAPVAFESGMRLGKWNAVAVVHARGFAFILRFVPLLLPRFGRRVFGRVGDAVFDRRRVASVASRRRFVTRLARLAGQLLSVGFDGARAPDELRARIAAGEVGGVMLFRPNIVDPPQVAALVGELRA